MSEAILREILAEQRRTNALLERLLAMPAGWPAVVGPVWQSPSTHVSPTGTVRSGWTTPPAGGRYMHEQGYLYGCPSMVGP